MRSIFARLPGTLSSAVVFRVGALRAIADDVLMQHMFGLPEKWATLAASSHVAVTSAGPIVVADNGLLLYAANGAPLVDLKEPSLLETHAAVLSHLPKDEPDCLGIGKLPHLPAAALHVHIENAIADGTAVFVNEPDAAPLEFLRSVGVTYLGGEQVGDVFLARFRNRLDQHLMAGALAGFCRTDRCNLFFMQHGSLDSKSRRGLLQASRDRVTHGSIRALQATRQNLTSALQRQVTLTCVPPAAAPTVGYGDIVPLGLMLTAVGSDGTDAARRYLMAASVGGLWPFHSGGLPTATDTGLVSTGIVAPDTLSSLEQFRVAGGGYVPQLWSTTLHKPGHMRFAPETRHWCQADFATTCLVAALRRRSGRDVGETWSWLVDEFCRRRGLFFANPYLVDWALSLLVAAANDTGDACEEQHLLASWLRSELLASQAADGSFGRHDVAFSTALGILALHNLKMDEPGLPRAQLRLLDFLGVDGRLGPCTPFFSSTQVPSRPDDEGVSLLPDAPEAPVVVDGAEHAITWYRDTDGVVSTAFAAMALGIPIGCGRSQRAHDFGADIHPRYCCASQTEYVAAHVLGRSTAPSALFRPRVPRVCEGNQEAGITRLTS